MVKKNAGEIREVVKSAYRETTKIRPKDCGWNPTPSGSGEPVAAS